MKRGPRFRHAPHPRPDRDARRALGQSVDHVAEPSDHRIRPTVGNAADDGAQSAGWFIGHFLDPAVAGLRATSAFEIKWSTHEKGDQRQCWAVDDTRTTVVMLIDGRLTLHLRDSDHLLAVTGDYIIWGPRTDHSWSVEERSLVITVRLPSA